MSTVIWIGMIILGLLIAALFKQLNYIGCFHTTHCMETILVALAVLSCIMQKNEWLILLGLSTSFWRSLIRVIADCMEASSKYKDEQKQK